MRRRKLRNRKKKTLGLKIVLLLSLVFILLILIWINGLFVSPTEYSIYDIPSTALERYFSLENKQEIPWYYFAAIDEISGNIDESNQGDYQELIEQYQSNEKNMEEVLSKFKSKRYRKKLMKKVEYFQEIDKVYRNKIFPLPQNISYEYSNTWGAERSYGGKRSHEGIDIMADKGVPIFSVGKGEIINIGWNELGGWRVGIQGEDTIYYYYAHLDSYAEGVEEGLHVEKGDFLGHVGNTGYGPEGTSGKFPDHLHFGMYENNTAVNPYPFLKSWE